ncbi:MAG: rhomboid family intramembrane serine protease [Lachnospiraceae bacterium]|nr:rhomboid family intramembrane serine protease [Lachnospiraceae bacterium]
MLDRIVELLYQKGYCMLDEQNKGVYIRETDSQVYVVILSMYHNGVSVKQCEALRSRIEFKVIMRYQKKIRTLYLFLTENAMFEKNLLELANGLSGAWFLAMDTGRIYVFETQSEQFDDLYNYFQTSLAKSKFEKNFCFTPVNMTIVALNILYFILIIVLNGGYWAIYNSDIMLSAGALSYDTFIHGAWYQIFSSLFIHFGFTHLINNMVLLTYVGCELEQRIGKLSFIMIYFASGLVGNVASLMYYNAVGEITISAGASGAIFGVIGALAINLFINHTETPNLTTRRLLVLAGITVYYGMTTLGVDNAAHIGGLICGIIGEFLLSKISRYVKLK